MKNKGNIKAVIIAVIISSVLSTSVTVLAENLISANQISYNNTTVADALDGMYRINSFQTNYLEDEKVVGTWIDGKPLYQKTISFTTCSTIGDCSYNFSNYNLSNIEQIYWFKAIIITNNSGGAGVANYYAGGNDNYRLWIVDSSTFTVGAYGAWTLNKPAYLTIQYTKTTDSTPSQNNAG